LIADLPKDAMLIADKGYDANALREAVAQRGAWANIPPKANRKTPICFSKHLYKARNLVERSFNKIKQFRRIATRYDKLAETFLAALKIATVRIWLRDNESASWAWTSPGEPETDVYQPRMVEQAFDGGNERPELEPVGRRGRNAIPIRRQTFDPVA
jgi:transposase